MDVLPLVGLTTPRHAVAAQVLGRRFGPDEMVSLAGAWLGDRWYSPSLCELAASGWDEPGIATLWVATFAELGVGTPSLDDAERLLAAPVPAVVIPAPRARPRRRVVPRHVPVRRR